MPPVNGEPPSFEWSPHVASLVAEGEVERFVAESNRIEGITRPPSDAELMASIAFLSLPHEPTVACLEAFVSVVQPGARLRTEPGMNVVIGEHVPPKGGPFIRTRLESLLLGVAQGEHPYALHVEYERLHPFMDGNGRSGRILWAWQMVHRGHRPGLHLGFLHAWYYQSLSAGRSAL